MFANLSKKLSSTLNKITGKGLITKENIQDSIREVKLALLEADVALSVVKAIIVRLEEKAVGQILSSKLTPSEGFVQILKAELTEILGKDTEELNLKCQPPAIILMAGLQGSGKTTSCAKLALRLKNQKKKVMLVSTDIYRPAAIEQLNTLAQEIDVTCFPSDASQSPLDITQKAIAASETSGTEVLIIDTAGRLHIDEAMMTEISAIHQAANPIETLFVVDSMTGQDAAQTAKVFHDTLALTGVILTKTDGDAKGGAALSIRHVTGKPIKFMGIGEKVTELEVFHPERITSRILGMGDLKSLLEEAEQKIDKASAKQATKKIKKGNFDLDDFKEQLLQMNKMGGMSSMLNKIPGLNNAPQLQQKVDDKEINKTIALINSMTPKEKRFPAILKNSRKQRIIKGSGTKIQDLNKLLKQFTQMQKMMKKMRNKGAMRGMMNSLQNMLGGNNFPGQ